MKFAINAIYHAAEFRRRLGRILARSWVKQGFTILSDDCWAGQLYHELGYQITTPTAGLLVEPQSYLAFVANIHQADACNLEFIQSSHSYPVARSPYATFHFMHERFEAEAREKFVRRFRRIDFDRLLVKVDFGKPGYYEQEILEWNRLRFPNSLALFGPQTITSVPIYNGVRVSNWVLDGAKMLNQSRRNFDLFGWVNGRGVHNSLIYRLVNFFLFDPLTPRRIKMFLDPQSSRA